MRTKVLVVIMTLFAGMASAQRRSSGGGGIKSAGTTKPSAVKASAARTAKPAANGTTQKSGQVKPTVVRQKITTAPSTSTRTGIMRTTAPAASASRTVVEYGHPSHSTWSRFWWGGGPYFGTWYRPGWYYPWAVYPSYWYWNGWSGYRFEYESRPADASGIKFDLGQIKAKADRKAIEEAGVYLPNDKGGKGYYGAVESFLKRKLPLDPGDYDVTVALADAREINLSVIVQPGRVTRVALRLDQPKQAQSVAKSDGNQPPLAPAPAPAK